MKALVNYDSDSDTERAQKQSTSTLASQPFRINPTPDVDTTALAEQSSEQINKQLAKFYKKVDSNTHLTGKVEQWNMNHYNFDEQYYSFNKYGVAHDPNPQLNNVIVNHGVSQEGFVKNPDIQIVSSSDSTFNHPSIYNMNDAAERQKKKQNKRMKLNDPSRGDFQGPWAGYVGKYINIRALLYLVFN